VRNLSVIRDGMTEIQSVWLRVVLLGASEIE